MIKFPDLILVDDEDVYKLDWRKFEDFYWRKFYLRIQSILLYSNSNLFSNIDVSDFINFLLSKFDVKDNFLISSKYNQIISELEFKIGKEYLSELEHHKNLAIDEYKRYDTLTMDTAVREKMLSVSISAIDNYFYLIADSLYGEIKIDPNNKGPYGFGIIYGFSQEVASSVIKSILLFKFWSRQTGRGLTLDRSFLNTPNHPSEIEVYQDLSNFISSLGFEEMMDSKIKSLFRDYTLSKLI